MAAKNGDGKSPTTARRERLGLRPIGIDVTADEHAWIERAAALDSRSIASWARLALVSAANRALARHGK